MSREQIQVIMDDAETRGAPRYHWDGNSLSTMVVRCHPDDEDAVCAALKHMAREIGGTNIKKELPT